MNFEYDIRRPRRSEGEGEVVETDGLTDERLVSRPLENFAEGNPATESGGCFGGRARPRAAGERAAHADKLVVLPYRQQDHTRSFAEGQFEVALRRVTNQHVANERHSWPAILQLANLRLPIRLGRSELMAQSLTTRQAEKDGAETTNTVAKKSPPRPASSPCRRIEGGRRRRERLVAGQRHAR